MIKKNLKQNSGQSTIEFVMTFTAAVGFIILFLKMALNYTDGYMVHHATYMAARTYMVNDQDRQEISEGDQKAFAKAQQVFTKYMPEDFVKNVSASLLQENNPEVVKFHALVGLHVQFSQKFSTGIIGGKESLKLISEAFLGREPTRSETRQQVCKAIMDLGLSKCEIHVTLDDNGG